MLQLRLMGSEIQTTSGKQLGFLGFLQTNRRPQTPRQISRAEVLYRQMFVAGEALLSALDQENRQDARLSAANEKVEWKMNRDRVERLARNYADALGQWRDALESEVSGTIAPNRRPA